MLIIGTHNMITEAATVSAEAADENFFGKILPLNCILGISSGTDPAPQQKIFFRQNVKFDLGQAGRMKKGSLFCIYPLLVARADPYSGDPITTGIAGGMEPVLIQGFTFGETTDANVGVKLFFKIPRISFWFSAATGLTMDCSLSIRLDSWVASPEADIDLEKITWNNQPTTEPYDSTGDYYGYTYDVSLGNIDVRTPTWPNGGGSGNFKWEITEGSGLQYYSSGIYPQTYSWTPNFGSIQEDQGT